MNLSLDQLPVNAFDLSLVILLGIGMMRGRKNGMSGELLSLLAWLMIIFGCAAIYEPAGGMFAQSFSFSMLSSFLIVYLLAGVVVFALFVLLRRALGGKLLGSDLFGRSEYYLGMVSGLVRFACIIVFGLALLNARHFSSVEVRAMEKFQNDVYGSNFFPGLHTVQATVFEKSFTGGWIRNNLGFLLIKPTDPEKAEIKRKEFQAP